MSLIFRIKLIVEETDKSGWKQQEHCNVLGPLFDTTLMDQVCDHVFLLDICSYLYSIIVYSFFFCFFLFCFNNVFQRAVLVRELTDEM